MHHLKLNNFSEPGTFRIWQPLLIRSRNSGDFIMWYGLMSQLRQKEWEVTSYRANVQYFQVFHVYKQFTNTWMKSSRARCAVVYKVLVTEHDCGGY